MAKTECARAGDMAIGSGAAWEMSSSLLELRTAMVDAPPTQLPMGEYARVRRTLRHEAFFFPLGFPVRVVSNSHRVLDAAAQSWSSFGAEFPGEPVEILLEVRTQAASSDALPPAPGHIIIGSLLFEVADADNFFIADLKTGRAMGRVTPGAVACQSYLRYFFLEAPALSMISNTRAIAVHGACVRAGGKGILLCGDSGEGKSTLAYAGARAGWTYLSDDATYIPMDREDRLALGNSTQVRFRPSAAELFPELAGRAITPRAAGKPSIEVRTSEWPELATANATRVDHVIFLNRRHAESQELVPMRPLTVWPWFRQHLISPPEMRPRQEAALSQLLSGGLFELRYRDLGWAINRINELARKGN